MLRLICSFCTITLVLAQSGTNYQTGDGQSRSESVDPEGNVRGQYSYVDPTGKTISVKYSAGKNGFQVEGDHIPPGTGNRAPVALQSAPYQVPTGPQDFPPFQPITGPDAQYPLFRQPAAPQAPGIPQFNQQPLFAPSTGASFGQAASQGQVSQYSQEQAALLEAQRTAAQPPRAPLLPVGTQAADFPRTSPAISGQPPQQPFTYFNQPQLTQEQLAQLSQNQAEQQRLAELRRAQTGQPLNEQQLIELSRAQSTPFQQQQADPRRTQILPQQLSREQLAGQQPLAGVSPDFSRTQLQQQQFTQQQLAELIRAQAGRQPLVQPQLPTGFNQKPQQSQFLRQQLSPDQLSLLRQAGITPTHRFGGTPLPDQSGAYNPQYHTGQ